MSSIHFQVCWVFVCICCPNIGYFVGLPLSLQFSVLRIFFTCCKWTEMCGRGLILAHSSAVGKLAQFSKEKQCPLPVMKSHISFSWFKVLVESGFLWPSEVKRLWNLNNRMQSWAIIHLCLQNGKSTTVKCSFWNRLLVDSIFLPTS